MAMKLLRFDNYTKFHLYEVPTCETELSQMDRDVGEVELAQSHGR
jgi:hypothetical protein